MREYLSVEEAGKLIAGEVAQYGASKSWMGNPDIAKALERHLSKFNIGYTDPNTGTWTHRRGGTRYFATLNFINNTKTKVGSIWSGLRKGA